MKYRNAGIQSKGEAIRCLIDGMDLRSRIGVARFIYDSERLIKGESPFRVIYSDGLDEPIAAHWDYIEVWQTPIDPLKESTKEKPVLAYRWDGDDWPDYPVATYIYFEKYSSSPHTFRDLFGNKWKHAKLVPVQDCAEGRVMMSKPYQASKHFKLWEYLQNEHGLNCTESELEDIAALVEADVKARCKESISLQKSPTGNHAYHDEILEKAIKAIEEAWEA